MASGAKAAAARTPAARAAAIMKAVSKRAYPLGDYAAQRPDAPEWFSRAVSRRPRRRHVAVDGADIELLTWGKAGRPGLLFLHGSGSNAGWWSFIAPFFADDYRCAAISWSGMGGSGHRPAYSAEQYAREVSAAIDAAGFAAGDRSVIVVAHSFGGYPAIIAANNDPRIGGLVLIDTLILPMALGDRPQLPPERDHPVFATLEEAMARFRLIPVNDVDNHYIVDWIARQSLRRVAGGWS
jgi:pimeloyl-ACP methyl ester carboxylesterase